MKAFKYDGKPITKDGIYVDVPMDDYHSGHLCAGRSVSSTALKRAARPKGSLKHYFAKSPYNPERVIEPRTEALDFGQAAHCRAFEPEKFDGQYLVSPYPDFKTKEAQQWKAGHIAEGRVVLTAGQFMTVARMAVALKAEPMAVSLFADGLPELTYVAKDEATGIYMLTRPDFQPASLARGPTDYKTAVSAEPEKWSRQAFDLGYHVQVGLALHVMELVEGEKRPTFWMIPQEKEEPYAVGVMRWEPDQIAYGQRIMRRSLDNLGRAFEAWDKAQAIRDEQVAETQAKYLASVNEAEERRANAIAKLGAEYGEELAKAAAEGRDPPEPPETPPHEVVPDPEDVPYDTSMWPSYTDGPTSVITPSYLLRAIEDGV